MLIKKAAFRMTRLVSTALICLIALSAAGCAVEVPKSVLGGYRLAPPDDAGKANAASQRRQDAKPTAVR